MSKIKPKEVFVNVPVVLLFNNVDEIPALAGSFNSFLNGKVKLKYDILGNLDDQFVSIFYFNRNDEYHDLCEKFRDLINRQEVNDFPVEEEENKTPVKVKRKQKFMPETSAMFCDHANEVPQCCTCKDNCYCKTHTCKS